MPPRLSLLNSLRASNGAFRQSVGPIQSNLLVLTSASNLSRRLFSSTCTNQAKAGKRKHRDPYALAQARLRKAANLARQEILNKERTAALGDPVRGISTPFVESLDHALLPVVDISNAGTTTSAEPSTSQPTATLDVNLDGGSAINYMLTPSDVRGSLAYSYALTKPPVAADRSTADPAMEEELARTHAERHEKAQVAISRIVSLANGHSKDRTRANIQRCIETFGRHCTDKFLAPKASSNVARDSLLSPHPAKTPRAGPDTGSPEVQVAILTAKIRVVVNHLQGQGGREAGGKKDKYNKRNLRLLVHRRQKMLQYLRTKERGGERWQNLITTLGLTEGTWKGEISL